MVAALSASSWLSAYNAAMRRGTRLAARAAVLRLQETRLAAPQVGPAMQAAVTVGWGAYVAPCTQGKGGKPSDGVAVCTKRHLAAGLLADAARAEKAILPARAAATCVRLHGLGTPLLIVSAYFEPSIGLAGSNDWLLAQIVLFCERAQLPFIIGGDFSCSPAAMEKAHRSCVF